ncbi:tyrosine-type recombinase/integrase [Methylobacterium sp. D54C]
MAYPAPAGWRLHTPRGHRKYLNPDKRRRFLVAADRAAPELRAFCHLLAWTGCRLSEALALASADLDAAAGNAGLHVSPNGLRPGFGVHAVRSGVPLNLLQRWLGHEHIATKAIYADVLGAEEREIAARMW